MESISCLIDPGLPLGYFSDVVSTFSPYIDFVKFGWASGLITDCLNKKIEVLRKNNVNYWFGGTLFEVSYLHNKLDDMVAWLRSYEVQFVEVSDGSIQIEQQEKLHIIEQLAREFSVLSEVGSKDVDSVMSPAHWVSQINSELSAGATRIITEGRESGTAGIYRSNGEVREGLLQEIMESSIDLNRLLFEAPKKAQQVFFIRALGHDVNMSNIAFGDVLNVVALRKGLRGDTVFLHQDSDFQFAFPHMTQEKEAVI